jgi:hypothetical protein
LNGLYSRVSYGSSIAWQRGHVVLAVGDNNYWQFKDRQLDGNYIPISQGSALALANSMTPMNEFFTTSHGGWSVKFTSSCTGSCTETSSSNTGTNAAEGASISAGVIVLIVVGSLIVVAFVLALIYCKCLWKSSRAFRRAGSEVKGAKDDDWRLAQKSPSMLQASGPRLDPELGGAMQTPHRSGNLRQAADSGRSHSHQPPVPPHAASTQSPMQSPTRAGEVYEGAVHRWWDGDGKSGTSLRPDAGWRGQTQNAPNASNSTWNSSGPPMQRNANVSRSSMGSTNVGAGSKAMAAFHSQSPNANESKQFADSRRLPNDIASSSHVPQVPSRSAMSGFPAPPLPPPATEPSDCGSERGAPSKTVWNKFSSGTQPSRLKSGKTIRGPSNDVVTPAARAMALAPKDALSGSVKGSFKGALAKPVGGTKQTKQVRISAPETRLMLDDLALAQKRNKAKLDALKAQLGSRY